MKKKITVKDVEKLEATSVAAIIPGQAEFAAGCVVTCIPEPCVDSIGLPPRTAAPICIEGPGCQIQTYPAAEL